MVLNLDAATDTFTDLTCPNCTAPLTIRSELDRYTSDDASTSSYSYSDPEPRKKKKRIWPWVLAVLFFLGLIGEKYEEKPAYTPQQNSGVQQIEVIGNSPADFGSEIRLVKTDGNGYAYSSSDRADKTLVWDSDADSYYDGSSECWLWYNTDVTPSLWQYWYEGISSDYGDFGWMEHDSEGWYIEASEGNWIDLPGRYDTSDLWWIEE